MWPWESGMFECLNQTFETNAQLQVAIQEAINEDVWKGVKSKYWCVLSSILWRGLRVMHSGLVCLLLGVGVAPYFA